MPCSPHLALGHFRSALPGRQALIALLLRVVRDPRVVGNEGHAFISESFSDG